MSEPITALERYGNHTPDCDLPFTNACSCGFEDALRASAGLDVAVERLIRACDHVVPQGAPARMVEFDRALALVRREHKTMRGHMFAAPKEQP